uniref:(northern house mosquito) hypothetical protein n=1 Tax=Culex pipiens TaxID=7175 RepID=A0A8D8CDB9_CULPI
MSSLAAERLVSPRRIRTTFRSGSPAVPTPMVRKRSTRAIRLSCRRIRRFRLLQIWGRVDLPISSRKVSNVTVFQVTHILESVDTGLTIAALRRVRERKDYKDSIP